MDIREDLISKIKILSDMLWEDKANQHAIDNWFDGFNRYRRLSEEEHNDLLYALGNFIYFGPKLIRELLKTVCRDLFKRPAISLIRRENNNSLDPTVVDSEFKRVLSETRFLGVGNPSESGQHLLYFFRQENQLPKNLFINHNEIFDIDKVTGVATISDRSIKHYIFLDDFCGSGTQAEMYLKKTVAWLSSQAQRVRVSYFSLVAMSSGLSYLKEKFPTLEVSTIFQLDDSFRAFHDSARYFDKNSCPPEISKERFKALCTEYSTFLGIPAEHLFGWGNSQLMIGFSYNTPDNTLPIFWYDDVPGDWNPIFKRYSKLYK